MFNSNQMDIPQLWHDIDANKRSGWHPPHLNKNNKIKIWSNINKFEILEIEPVISIIGQNYCTAFI